MSFDSKAPLVSIVIPCFNTERYVAEAIRSALGQTYRHKEVIVIDDGSTDGSVDILRSFGAAIRWETGPNRGACAARNRGLQLAQGERIQFLDADDLLHPQKVQIQIERLQSQPNATPVCDGELVDSDFSKMHFNAPETCQDSLIPLLNGPLHTLSPLHLKKSLTGVGGFNETLPCSQERDLHLRLACNGWPLQRIPQTLYTIRRVPGSVSSSHVKVLLQHLPLAARVRESLQQQQKWTDANARALSAFLTKDARHLARLGHYEQAALYFDAARNDHPSGGWEAAYGRFQLVSRLAAKVIGPVNLERLLRKLRGKSQLG